LRQEATQVARQLLEDFPEAAESLGVVALLHRRLGRVDQAERCWQRCLELEPRSANAHIALAAIARRNGDLAKAAEHFQKAMEIDPESRQLPYDLAEVLINQGELDRAQAVVQKNLERDATFFPSLYQLGQIHLQRKDYAKARKVLETAIRFGPDFAATYFALSTACSRLGDAEQAGRYLDKFRVLRARDEEAHRADLRRVREGESDMPSIVAEINTTASRVYLQHGQQQTAEKLLLRGFHLAPGYVQCGDTLAWLYEQQGRAEEALSVLSKADASSPKSVAVLVRLGTLAAKLGRFDEAERAYQKAIEAAPGQARAYGMLADLYLQANRKPHDAKRLAQKAVELQPEPALYRLLSAACEKTGDTAGARAALQKASTPSAGADR
jgi:tetratricopeptide (TPR) repeat protein